MLYYIHMKNTSNEDTDVVEGEVLMPGEYNVIKDKQENVKIPKKTKLSLKAQKFIENYKEGNTMGNATKSAIKAGYSEVSASSYGSQLLKNPKVLAVLNESVEEAERVIRDLMYTSESDAVRMAAAKEVLDRTIGKSVQRSESTQVNINVEMMLNGNDD